MAFSWCFYPFYLLPLPFLLQTVIIIIYSCCRGLPVGRKGRKKEKDPFREAFGRVKDMRSVLPGIPVLALTASVQVTERAKLMKTCGMHKPVTVDVSPNKENIAFNFISIPNEKDAVTHLKWIADMVVEKGKECPQTIVFCNTFNDISAVLSYLLLVLKDKAFTEGPNGKKAPLLSVYHAKTWEAQKMAIEEDFKSDGLKRVVIATCALGMGINFPKVQYVVQYGPPTSIVDLMQQAGRGGRDGRQAHCITYFTKRQLSRCGKEVKSVVKTDKCQREALYSHFSDSISCLSPGHLCCSPQSPLFSRRPLVFVPLASARGAWNRLTLYVHLYFRAVCVIQPTSKQCFLFLFRQGVVLFLLNRGAKSKFTGDIKYEVPFQCQKKSSTFLILHLEGVQAP